MATCTYTVPDKNASGDNFYGAVICNQAYIDYFWNTYGFSGNKALLGRRLGMGRLLQHEQAAGPGVQRLLRADLLGPGLPQRQLQLADPELGPPLRPREHRRPALLLRRRDGHRRSKGGGLVEVLPRLLLHQGRSRAGGDADPRVAAPGRQAARRELPDRLDVRRRQVGRRFDLGLRGSLDVRRAVPVVVLRGRGPAPPRPCANERVSAATWSSTTRSRRTRGSRSSLSRGRRAARPPCRPWQSCDRPSHAGAATRYKPSRWPS